MSYLICFLVGLAAGGLGVWLLVMGFVETWKGRDRAGAAALVRAAEQQADVDRRTAQQAADHAAAVQQVADRQAAVNRQSESLKRDRVAFDQRVVSYGELRAENNLLKRDLHNIDVQTNKLEIDGEDRERRMADLTARGDALAKRFLGDTVKSVVDSLGPSNFTACKQRLLDAVQRCRAIGYVIPPAEEASLLAALRAEFERAVRATIEREEQARIKAQIREEERLKREVDRELKQLDRERAAVQAALDVALAAARGQHSAEVDVLKQRLAEAEEKRRAISMAEQTKAGHVYVISNIGTFGTDIYKIGMTRRLKPEERIDELGSASVPFPFDVHMMIGTTNAPALEHALHRALHKVRVNKANPRKEFFRVKLDDICKLVAAEHDGTVEYRADPEALEYRQSQSMSDEDAAFVERVYADAEPDEPPEPA